ncbi:MAG: Gfo/Idh/MocA family oxidoreductase [Planctomycetes bacterium]|nr:Gfo/Idh/MocA family oxidoreductase [Planctomycetota bacterium]
MNARATPASAPGSLEDLLEKAEFTGQTTMSEAGISFGILGLDSRGRLLLEALSGVGQCRVQAVADTDSRLLKSVSDRYGCDAYDDYRQFIIQNEFDTLVIAANLHRCRDTVRMAIKEGIHCLKLVPMARDFEEACELWRLAQGHHVRFDVANPLRYHQGFQALGQLLRNGTIDRPFLARLWCDVGVLADEDPQQPDSQKDWITDQELAGGGVMLHNAYPLIDQLIECFGVPQQVYSLCNSQASDRQQLHHLTEDTALITMRFSESMIADSIAMRHWDDRPASVSITVHGREQIVTASLEGLTIQDQRGRTIQADAYAYDALGGLRSLLADYELSFRKPREHPFASDGPSNLKRMAVIQAAYLSARTGSPEEPERILGTGK